MNQFQLSPQHIMWKYAIATLTLDEQNKKLMAIVESQAKDIRDMKDSISGDNLVKLVGNANRVYIDMFKESQGNFTAIVSKFMVASPENAKIVNDAVRDHLISIGKAVTK